MTTDEGQIEYECQYCFSYPGIEQLWGYWACESCKQMLYEAHDTHKILAQTKRGA